MVFKFSKVNLKDNQFQHSPRVRMVTQRHTHSTGASGHMRAGGVDYREAAREDSLQTGSSHDNLRGKGKGGKTRAVNPSYNFTKERFRTELNISTLQSDLSHTPSYFKEMPPACTLHKKYFQSLCWHYTLGKGMSHWELHIYSTIRIVSFLNKQFLMVGLLVSVHN